MEAFLSHDESLLCSVEEHGTNMVTYLQIANYG